MNSIKALLRSVPFSALLLLALTLSLTGLNQLPGNADSGYSYARDRVKNTTPISNISVSLNASLANTLAQAHWSAIADGDLTKVMSQYGESPILHWIGRPLAGEYQGKESL